MALLQILGSSSSYWLISFDKSGRERDDDAAGVPTRTSDRLLLAAAAEPPSDVFLFSHGWKGDVPSTKEFYERWFGALLARSEDINRMGTEFRPMWVGVHWPSQPFGDESLGASSFAAPAGRVSEALSAYTEFFDEGQPDVANLLKTIFDRHLADAGALSLPPDVRSRYQELAAAIGYTAGPIDGPPEADGVAVDPEAAFDAALELGDAFGEGTLEAGLLSPLRQLSFWMMKKRARTVGEGGLHELMVRLQQAFPQARFHLVGHSFGCIVVTAAMGGPGAGGTLPRPADSLVLVQGAVSHWAYADRIMGVAKTGYFNKLLRRPAVRGVTLTTRSRKDRAVGLLYPLAVGLVGQVSFPTSAPLFGGIGTWGIQGCAEADDRLMASHDTNYHFKPGAIVNLDAGNFIAGHSEIFDPSVAHAIWQAALPARSPSQGEVVDLAGRS